MNHVAYRSARSIEEAVGAATDGKATYVAGGTDLVPLIQLGLRLPEVVVGIAGLKAPPMKRDGNTLVLSAFSTMSEIASHPLVRQSAPAVVQALLASASPQIRNAATLGGNLLQQTRCQYYRDQAFSACNKRTPASGCAALHGDSRRHAVFGTSDQCIAPLPSDLAVALTAVDGRAVLHRSDGEQGLASRTIPLGEFYVLPNTNPERATIMQPGDLISEIEIDVTESARHSRFIKIRDRSSFDFALASIAVAAEIAPDGIVSSLRIVLGGVAPVPWRLRELEDRLRGTRLEPGAVMQAIQHVGADARPTDQNSYKVAFARNLVVRALRELVRR